MSVIRALVPALKWLIAINILIPIAFIWFPPGLMAEGDSIDYRLPLIDWAIRHGKYPNFSWTYVDDFPALAEILMAVTRLFADWGPRLVSVGGYILFVFGSLRLGKLMLPRQWALAGTLMIAAMNVVTTQDNLLMVDLFAASMTLWASVYLVSCWRSNRYQARHVVKAGLFAGAALATRYTQLAPIAVLGALILAMPVGRGLTPRLRAFGMFAGLATLVFLPWLIRNMVVNGNPFYPLLTPIFGGNFFNSDRHQEVFSMVGSKWGFGKSLIHFIALPFRFALYPDAFDYSVGPHTLMFLPWCALFIAFTLKKQKTWAERLRMISPVLMAFIFLLAWFAVSQEGRFLIHVVPAGVFSGLAGMVLWSKFVKSQKVEWALIGLIVFFGAAATFKHARKHKQELNPQEALRIYQPHIATWLNANMKDGKVLLMQRTLNLSEAKRDFVFAYPHVYSTSRYDHRHYKDIRTYCNDLYDEGVRYMYFTHKGFAQKQPVIQNCPIRVVYAPPEGGYIYALDKI